MTSDDVIRATAAIATIAWALLALAGWLLPLRDGVARFTFRYLAWGALIVAWMGYATTADRWWWMAVYFALALWGMDRAAHWWRASERTRALR